MPPAWRSVDVKRICRETMQVKVTTSGVKEVSRLLSKRNNIIQKILSYK